MTHRYDITGHVTSKGAFKSKQIELFWKVHFLSAYILKISAQISLKFHNANCDTQDGAM